MTTDNQVQWPSTLVDKDGADLGAPLHELLHRLSIIGTDDEEREAAKTRFFKDVPISIASIESTATTFAKAWTAVLGIFGFGTLTVAGVLGKAGVFYAGEAVPVQVAIMAGLALLLTALIVAIAVIIQADARARGQAMVATYDARATVATAFLAGVEPIPSPKPTPPSEPHFGAKDFAALLGASSRGLVAQPKGHAVEDVDGVRYHDGKIEVRIRDAYYGVDELEYFESSGGTLARH